MRNLAYYLSLTLVCVIIISLLSVVLLLIGVFDFQFNWGYSLGSVLGIPALWLISVAITMFLRPIILRTVLKESKEYSKTTAIILLILGVFWLCGNVYLSFVKRNTIEAIEKSYYQKQKDIEETEELSYIKEIEEEKSFIEEINNVSIEICRAINQQAPIRVYDFMILKGAIYTDFTLTYLYTIELEKSDITETEWSDFLSEMKEGQKSQIPSAFMKINNVELDKVVDFFRLTNMKFIYIFYDINDLLIGTTQFDYNDFEK